MDKVEDFMASTKTKFPSLYVPFKRSTNNVFVALVQYEVDRFRFSFSGESN